MITATFKPHPKNPSGFAIKQLYRDGKEIKLRWHDDVADDFSTNYSCSTENDIFELISLEVPNLIEDEVEQIKYLLRISLMIRK